MSCELLLVTYEVAQEWKGGARTFKTLSFFWIIS